MNKKKWSRLTKISLVIVSIPILIYFWPMALGGDSEVLIVQGPSMLPTILPGSLILTKAVPEYQVDDIVSFNLIEKTSAFGLPDINRIVVHRIIEIAPQGFVIKGDNNRQKDAGFPTEDVIRGKVFLIIPYFGTVFELLRNPLVLVSTAIASLLIQSEQKRRKNRKEKLRRIRLGLPSKPDNYEATVQNKKPIKPDYSLFYVALSLNVVVYVTIQISIVYDILPLRDMGDIVTGFLFRQLTASLASTLSFSFYFVFLFGVYFLTKLSFTRHKKSKHRSKVRSGNVFEELLGKDFNPLLSIAQILWVLFILLSLFHLLSMSQGLISYVVDTCDPTTKLC